MGRIHWTTLGLAALLVAGCGSAANSAATSATSAPPSSAAATSPAAAPSSPAPASTAPAQPTAPPATSSPVATTVYLAPAQNLSGTPLMEPACTTLCALSGDSTAFLSAMTWQTWTASEATGSGTYKLDDCQPDCAQGTVHAVPVVVTFSQPVRACQPAVRWFWSRASFTFPKGLPQALQGQNAPQNPWDFTALTSAAQQSCG